MSDRTTQRRRYAIVGTGSRAEMFARAIAVDRPGTCELVALADTNPVRMAAHNALLAGHGVAPVPTYPAAEFARMLEAERVDVAVVTTVDRFHDEYIVAALDAGRDAITEKPMTIDAARCRRILDAVDRTGRQVTVTFNYRYNPVHEAVRRVLMDGEIGEVGSVHFEWLLDVRHGADYFRRWHRERANSGGLMVHKASHHFDLVNWWLATEPTEVYAVGRLFFYGDEAGRRHGYARDYERADGSAAAEGDPFALRMADHPRLRALYLEAEHADGYHRDRNVFAPGTDIEDDMAVLVRYATGASMSYHLTAYAPWEGYRVMFNGSRGRLELEVVESDHVSPAVAGGVKGLFGADDAEERGWARLTLRQYWQPPREVPLPGRAQPEPGSGGGEHAPQSQARTRGGHGGADARMLATLLDGDAARPDELGRRATERDGARALLVGLAANESFKTGRPTRVADLLSYED